MNVRTYLVAIMTFGVLAFTLPKSNPSHAADQPISLNERLVSEIRSGQDRLAHNVASCSGTVVRRRGPLNPQGSDSFSLEGLKDESRYRFYVADESYRVDYLAANPSERKSQGPDRDSVVESLVTTPRAAYAYRVVSTTGSPYATLFKYRNPKANEVRVRLDSDLVSLLFSLFAPAGTKAVDLLQRPEAKLFSAKSNAVPNAIKIAGSFTFDVPPMPSNRAPQQTPDASKATSVLASQGTSEYEILLDPASSYAVRHYTITTTTVDTRISIEGTVRITQGDGSKILPKQIAIRAEARTLGKGRDGGSAFDYREVVEIEYAVSPPDLRLFTEQSFAALKRSFTVVNVDERNSMQVGNTTQVHSSDIESPTESGLQKVRIDRRWIPLIVGNLLLVILLLILIYRRRRRRIRSG